MAFEPKPRKPGELIKSGEWNEVLDELVRLGNLKDKVGGGGGGDAAAGGDFVKKTGDTIKGKLAIEGGAGEELLKVAGVTHSEGGFRCKDGGTLHMSTNAKGGKRLYLALNNNKGGDNDDIVIGPSDEGMKGGLELNAAHIFAGGQMHMRNGGHIRSSPKGNYGGRQLTITHDGGAGDEIWMGSNVGGYTGHIQLNAQDITLSTGGKGPVNVWGSLNVTGGTKNFAIEHPEKPGWRLIHAAVEAPEAGVYYRGEGVLADGQARVGLPDYFEALTRKEGRTVQLTCQGAEPFLLSATRVENGAFQVFGTRPEGAFFWEVKAVRNDVAPLQVEIPPETQT